MDCWYCQRIKNTDLSYPGLAPSFDMGSETPRCSRHWRYTCELCSRPFHFQGMAFCPEKEAPFCARCALASQRVEKAFWAWAYHFKLRCPFCALWHPSLDYAEHVGMALPSAAFLSAEKFLNHHFPPEFVPVEGAITDKAIDSLWSENVETWSRLCGPEGDAVRRYVTDPVLFSLLGDVHGKVILDAGCGEGYLSRKLAAAGAAVWGVENALALYEKALAHEKKERQGIRYTHGSIGEMPDISARSMDFIVCNNVMMYCADIRAPLSEFRRVLKEGGSAILVFTHPCFWGPGTMMHRSPPDTPHKEEWVSRLVSDYFNHAPKQFIHPDYGNPLVFFKRTLGDYFAAFTEAGFRIARFLEPDVIPEMKGKLPGPELPTSVVFSLEPA